MGPGSLVQAGQTGAETGKKSLMITSYAQGSSSRARATNQLRQSATIQRLSSATPPLEALTSLFNLTPDEAAVALALGGGRSAEQVTDARQVSTGTVRSQIKVILGKSGAANLRELEQIMASLSNLPGYRSS
jgi:DNA-binding NarL/FixJ family response regulator